MTPCAQPFGGPSSSVPLSLPFFFSSSSSDFSLRFCTTSQLYTLAMATSMVWERRKAADASQQVARPVPYRTVPYCPLFQKGRENKTNRNLLAKEIQIILAVFQARLGRR